jgi:lipoate-protein ligase A
MQRLLVTLDTPAENLALDEALLDWAEEDDPAWEFLRLWESPWPMVVVGRSSRVGAEVDQAACAERRIPILRRSSGGAAIVAGPGCLMYAVVLSYKLRPELRDIHQAHQFVLARLAEALRARGQNAQPAGTSDLVLADCGLPASAGELPADCSELVTARKFSGNSMRAKRSHFLYHGTLLYDFDLRLVDACLRTPPRQPAYRGARDHRQFLINLPLGREMLVEAVLAAWPTTGDVDRWPRERVNQLVADRFGRDDWNLAFGDG